MRSLSPLVRQGSNSTEGRATGDPLCSTSAAEPSWRCDLLANGRAAYKPFTMMQLGRQRVTPQWLLSGTAPSSATSSGPAASQSTLGGTHTNTRRTVLGPSGIAALLATDDGGAACRLRKRKLYVHRNYEAYIKSSGKAVFRKIHSCNVRDGTDIWSMRLSRFVTQLWRLASQHQLCLAAGVLLV